MEDLNLTPCIHPAHPSSAGSSVDPALFGLSTRQVVSREVRAWGKPKGDAILSCHIVSLWPWWVATGPGDLDTFLGLASHSHSLGHNPVVVCHSGQGCVHSCCPTEEWAGQLCWSGFAAPGFVTGCSTRFSLHCFWASASWNICIINTWWSYVMFNNWEMPGHS